MPRHKTLDKRIDFILNISMPDDTSLGQLPIDTLRTFVAAAESGSFTRAGERVHRTQSAVSMQMKRLEDDTGSALFLRRGRGMALTAHGASLLGYARRILALHDEAVASFNAPELSGRVRLGASESYAALHLPRLLATFARDYPDVRVDLMCKTSSKLRRDMNLGRLDLAICICGDEPDGGEPIHHEPVVWMAPRDHRPEDMDPLPLAVYHYGCYHRAWAEKALQEAGRAYRIAYCSPSIAALSAAVRAGLAISPVAASSVPADCRVLGPAEGLPLLPVSTVTLHRPNTSGDTLCSRFATYVTDCFADLD